MKQRFAALSLLAALMLAVCLAGAAFAQDAPRVLTHHVRDVTANGQAPLVGHLPATQSMRLVLVLPHRDEAGLKSFLKDLYNPSSSSYRHFLTVDQFTAKYGPSKEDYAAVARFAQEHGLTVVKTSRNRMNIDVTGTVANIEKALNINLGVYQHPTEKRTFFAPDREPRPNLSVQLWHIQGLDNYSTPHAAYSRINATSLTVHSNATTGSCPEQSFCGSDMRAAYYEGTSLTGTGQSLGLFELLGTDLTDLDDYFKNANQVNNVPITLDSVDTQSVNCTYNSAGDFCDDTEQTIDMSQAIGMAPGLSSLVMYIGTGGFAGQTVDDAGIFNAMATASPLNAQLSCSWEWRPPDPDTDNPYFEEFAAQGQNLFIAAGDDGDWAKADFVYPADDVYITSVGGTDLETTGAGGDWASETAWTDGGGGISPNKYTIPSWQVETAAGCATCSQTYRNGPDVSGNANYTFYVCSDQGGNPNFGGQECGANIYGGTSFATPMWAGYLALTNQQALANGEAVLGFINPSLYTIGLSSSYDTDFHDVTSGCQFQKGGYCATVGYDQVTGWGSPNGDNLINALAPIAAPSFSVSASPKALKIAQGSSGTTTITTTIAGSFDSAITLTSSLKSVSFNPATIAAPGAGTSTATISIGKSTPVGKHAVKITATGGGITNTVVIEIDVTD
jgi:subtilase family serine protease